MSFCVTYHTKKEPRKCANTPPAWAWCLLCLVPDRAVYASKQTTCKCAVTASDCLTALLFLQGATVSLADKQETQANQNDSEELFRHVHPLRTMPRQRAAREGARTDFVYRRRKKRSTSPLLLFFAPVTSEASPGMGGNAERHDNVCSFTFFP